MKSVRFSVAPIGLQRIVYEMTLLPRPASLRQTITVETDHPLYSVGNPVNSGTCSQWSLQNLFEAHTSYNMNGSMTIPSLAQQRQASVLRRR